MKLICKQRSSVRKQHISISMNKKRREESNHNFTYLRFVEAKMFCLLVVNYCNQMHSKWEGPTMTLSFIFFIYLMHEIVFEMIF